MQLPYSLTNARNYFCHYLNLHYLVLFFIDMNENDMMMWNLNLTPQKDQYRVSDGQETNGFKELILLPFMMSLYTFQPHFWKEGELT